MSDASVYAGEFALPRPLFRVRVLLGGWTAHSLRLLHPPIIQSTPSPSSTSSCTTASRAPSTPTLCGCARARVAATVLPPFVSASTATARRSTRECHVGSNSRCSTLSVAHTILPLQCRRCCTGRRWCSGCCASCPSLSEKHPLFPYPRPWTASLSHTFSFRGVLPVFCPRRPTKAMEQGLARWAGGSLDVASRGRNTTVERKHCGLGQGCGMMESYRAWSQPPTRTAKCKQLSPLCPRVVAAFRTHTRHRGLVNDQILQHTHARSSNFRRLGASFHTHEM